MMLDSRYAEYRRAILPNQLAATWALLRHLEGEARRFGVPTVSEPISGFRELAADIANSKSVLAVFAAPEWDWLHDDGKEWVAAIVREALTRAAASHLSPISGPAPLGRSGAERVAPTLGAIGGER